MSTLTDFLEQLGDWNPQLLREIRGRVKQRTLVVAIVVPVVLQILLFASFAQIPIPPECLNSAEASSFCSVTPAILWRIQFFILSVLIPLGIYVLGGFTLVDDLGREEFRGTLSFIRISPRSSSSIILGKVLGVPILSFLSVLLLLPYHWLAALGAGFSLVSLLSYYLMIGAGAAFIYSFGILVAFFTADLKVVPRLGNISGIPFVYSFFCIYFTVAYLAWNFFTAWIPFWSPLLVVDVDSSLSFAIQWFFLSLSGNSLLAHVFTLGNGAIATTAIWWILRRRFHNPNLPLLSKFLSYPVVSYLHLLGLGFLVVGSQSLITSIINLTKFYLLFSGDWLLFVLLILTLTPDRQALLDWARYGSRAVVRDLLWADRSPSMLAIALNLLVTASTTLLWIQSWNDDMVTKERATLLTISLVLLLLMYALAVQLIAYIQLNQARTWMLGFVALVTLLPLIVLPIFQLTPQRVPFLWIFFGYTWAAADATPSAILLALALQGGMVCLLGWLLLEQMRRARVLTSSS
jgi:hypothetical protein